VDKETKERSRRIAKAIFLDDASSLTDIFAKGWFEIPKVGKLFTVFFGSIKTVTTDQFFANS
jgi:hypothetical protein